MKTTISTLLLLLTLSMSAQWHFQNPLHSGYNYGLIKFEDRNNGRILYNNGDYLSTTNGGNNWDITYCNPKVEIEGKYFVNENLGWGIKYSEIWNTTDGGYSWTLLPTNFITFFPESIRSIYFINEDTGFLIEGDGNIWRSMNGGLDWERVKTSGAHLNLIRFRDVNVGYVVGSYGVIMKTTDGGDNWSTLNTPGWETCKNILFFGNDTIYVSSGSHSILKSYNDGASWFEQTTSINGIARTMTFLNKNLGYAFGNNGLIYKTYDGGINWVDQSVEMESDRSLGGAYFFDENHGIVVGSNGYLFKTDNGGEKWTDLSYGSRATMFDIEFMNDSHGFSVGMYGHIMKTDNGGRNWVGEKLPVNENLFAISFINNLDHMISGNNGTLFYTSNSGNSWEKINSSITSHIMDIHFTTLESGLLLCKDGKVYKTNNQCETTTLIRNESTETYSKLFFTDSQNAFIVGQTNQNGLILKTTDGGDNWIQVLKSERTLSDIDFIDNYTGWAVGNFGQVFRTNDAGITWDSLDIGETIRLSGVSFANSTKGWVTGEYGRYYETNDGGNTWTQCPKFNRSNFTSVCSINDTTVWVVGGFGEIINHGIAQSTGIEEPQTTVTPINILCYPNPFREKTFVDINIKKRGNINIYIYDTMGKLVYFGQNYCTNPGKFTLKIDGNSLTTGIYSLRIITQEKEMYGKISVIH